MGRIISSDYIGSSASIDSKGFELEASARPMSGLTLTANFGLSDARYRDLQIDATTNARGKRVKLVPSYDGYLAARYETPGGFYGRAEVSFTGKEPLESLGLAMQPATQTQVGYDADRWGVRLFVENLADVRRGTGLAFRNLGIEDRHPLDRQTDKDRQLGRPR